MVILHCLKQATWESYQDKKEYGKELVTRDGLIHCSSVENFWRVAPNFNHIKEPLVLLCIDTTKVNAEIRWEDFDNCGRTYPHIYGVLNIDAIIEIVPFLKDEHEDFFLNEELKKYL